MSTDSEEFFDAPSSPTTFKPPPSFSTREKPPTTIGLGLPPPQRRNNAAAGSISIGEKRSSVDGLSTPRPHGVQIAFQPPTPNATPALTPRSSKNGANAKPEKSGTRRRKLDGLRHRMQDDYFEPETLAISSDSASEATSICSWGRHLLGETQQQTANVVGDDTLKEDSLIAASSSKNNSTGRPNLEKKTSQHGLQLIVQAFDTISTKGGDPPPIIVAEPEEKRLSESEEFSTKAPVGSGSKSGTLSESDQLDTGQKSASSTGSSKSGTLERFNTADNSSAGGSGSKSNSLERGLRGPPGGLSSTLSRELSLSVDEPKVMAEMRRKNSEAAELIELLTSEIVHGVKIERDSRQRNVSSSSTGRRQSSSNQFDEKKSKTIPVVGNHSLAMEEEKNSRKCSSLDSTPRENVASHSGGSPERDSGLRVENGDKQPDIVASAVGGCRQKLRMKKSPSPSKEPGFAEPIAPPRRRKRHTQEYGSSGGSLVSALSDAPFSAPVLSGNQDEYMKWTMLKNLDTGKSIPLGEAGKLSSIDPITFHALRRMSMKQPNYAQSVASTADYDSDTSSVGSVDGSVMSMPINPTLQDSSYLSLAKESAKRYRRSLGKRMGRAFQETAKTVKTAADEVSHKLHGAEEESSQSDEETQDEDNGASQLTRRQIRVRARHSKKGPFDFEQMRQVQTLSGEHSTAIWSLKFSICGRLLASAGQDNAIRIWVLKDAFEYFNDMRQKYNMEARKANASVSNLTDPLLQTMTSMSSTPIWGDDGEEDKKGSRKPSLNAAGEEQEDNWSPFMAKPFCVYKGHTADVLDIAWSKSYFLLSSSMDRTVRLWHISRTECLCVFQHIDFVTSIAFLPKDDKFFLSGSLDGKLRVWNITEKKVALWNEVEGSRLITALAFVNNGKYAVVGTFDGKCFFYTSDQLKYHTTIDVKSTRGKNARGHKITGLAVYSDRSRGDKLLVTSNDCRIRLYDLSNLSLTCKYKGASNYSSQIRANFSPDGRHVICGSEDRYLYLWRTSLDAMTLSVRKDRNGMWERVRAHNSVVTAAIFAPKPELIFDQMERAKLKFGSPSIGGDLDSQSTISAILPRRDSTVSSKKLLKISGDIIVSADFQGNIMVFVNRTKVKTGGSVFFPAY